MKLNPWQNIFRVIVNANAIVEHTIEIKNEITKHVNVNVKIILLLFAIIMQNKQVSYKIENDKFKKVCIKNRTCIISMTTPHERRKII